MPKQKEYLTIEETASELGIDRSTVYLKLKVLGIQATKFPGNRKKFLARRDVDRIKSLQEEPWKEHHEYSTTISRLPC